MAHSFPTLRFGSDVMICAFLFTLMCAPCVTPCVGSMHRCGQQCYANFRPPHLPQQADTIGTVQAVFDTCCLIQLDGHFRIEQTPCPALPSGNRRSTDMLWQIDSLSHTHRAFVTFFTIRHGGSDAAIPGTGPNPSILVPAAHIAQPPAGSGTALQTIRHSGKPFCQPFALD